MLVRQFSRFMCQLVTLSESVCHVSETVWQVYVSVNNVK